MKNSIVSKPKLLFICLLVLTLLPISAYAVPVSLGTAANFAVLGGSGVTNAQSGTWITGDVGSSPTESVSGITAGMVTGNLYLAGDASAVKAQAHADASAAYTAAHDATGGAAGPADLGGVTLTPGVYTYGVGAATWTYGAGDLTLNALGNPSAQWIFQIGTTLITPADARVLLINGASANNVFWQVGTSATLGGTNTFAGNILADQSITLGGGTLNGRALAINALVSIPTATTINVPTTIPEPATLCLLGLGGLAMMRKRRA
jgi:hypothetical protein